MTRLAALGKVTDKWLAPENSFRQNSVSALQVSTGYSPHIIARALDAAFSEITLSNLQAYGGSGESELTVLHIAAGNVFTAWLHGAVISLLLGHRVWIKPSSQERVFPSLWRQSLRDIDATLAEAVRIVNWDDALLQEADVVIAYGSDETLQLLRQKAGSKPFVGYGHKVSAAVVFAEAGQSDADVIEAVWQDVDAFDLQGCLSPQVIYVEGNSTVIEEAIKKRKPSGPWPRWKSFRALASVCDDLSSVRKYLSCVGVAGSEAQRADIKAHFQSSPEIRICELGRMQRPPLTWRNGGIDLREFFQRKNKLG